MPLLLAENSTLYGAIGVAGVTVVILYSLGLLALWVCSENDAELDSLPWVFGSAAILYVTTTIQRIL